MIIGFVGYKQSGKSTGAKYLADKYGYTRFNMKDALICEIKENFNELLAVISCVYKLDTDELFEQKPPLARALMQNYGTDVRRKDDVSYWVTKWLEKTEGLENAIVDDIRFMNEAEAVKNKGGVLIRINRDDITTGGSHISETEQENIVCDFTVETSKGELNIMYNRLDEIQSKLSKV